MLRKIVILFIVLLCINSALTSEQPYSKTEKSNFQKHTRDIKQFILSPYRLPRNIAPRSYVLDFDLDFTGDIFTFNGNSSITFQVFQYSAIITFHKSDKLDIIQNYTELILDCGDSQKPIEQVWRKETEFFTLKFDSDLKPGNHTLKLKWVGHDGSLDQSNPNMGFFRTIILNDSRDDNKYLVATHFEPTGARDAFPCWDEPGLKAEFTISVKHFANYTALSNMHIISRKKSFDGKIVTQFERTPNMSPYLPCVVVSDYGHIENRAGNITFYTLEEDIELVRHALEISEKVIEAMELYTGIPYMLPKLDQITVPQLNTPGMEHWGLVTYLPSAVILRNTTLIPNLSEQDEVTFLVAHELAHQWFGNLVSPKWWDDLWLSEAFSTYFQYKALDIIFPDWHIMDYFVIKHVNDYSFLAEVSTTQIPRPIKWMPQNKQDADDMFTPVQYDKGSGILLMLENILGEDVFRNGIRRYLNSHQFKAVDANDLWDDLQNAYDKKYENSSLNIKNTMEPWLEQNGHPILNVTRNYDTGLIHVAQQNVRNFQNRNTWKIPLNYITSSNLDSFSTASIMWIEKNEKTVEIPNIHKDDWIILNINLTGFYQVIYDRENWCRIANYLNTENFINIPTVNRAQLIRDAFDIYHKDRDFLHILVKLTSYLHRETEYAPWMPTRPVMDEFHELMRNTPVETAFKKYVLVLLSKVMSHAGFDNHVVTNNSGMRIRRLLSSIACKFEHPECLAAGARLFEAYLMNPTINAFPKDDWDWIFCSGLRNANETIWESFMTGKYPENFSEKKKRKMLACTKNVTIRDKFMDNYLTKNESLNNVDRLIIKDPVHILIWGDKNDVDYTLKYVFDHFDNIENKYFARDKQDKFSIPWLLTKLSRAVKTEEQWETFQAFLEPRMERLKKQYEYGGFDTMLELMKPRIKIAAERARKFHELMDEKLLELNII